MQDPARLSRRSRRQHDREFKEGLIAQSLVAGASVASIAMEGGVNANLLFKWRREHVRMNPAAAPVKATLLPVCVIPEGTAVPVPQPPMAGGAGLSRGARQGVIEIEIAGAQLRIRGAVDEATLGSVLRALRQSE